MKLVEILLLICIMVLASYVAVRAKQELMLTLAQ